MLGPAYQLIFNRRVTKRTPSRYRTRVITDGVTPSLHVDYKRSRIKQYFKEGRALRTETVINDTYDFGIGRSLKNLEDLEEIGFAANRRLLDVQRISHDCPASACSDRQPPGVGLALRRSADPGHACCDVAVRVPAHGLLQSTGARTRPDTALKPAAMVPARRPMTCAGCAYRGFNPIAAVFDDKLPPTAPTVASLSRDRTGTACRSVLLPHLPKDPQSGTRCRL